MSDTYKTLGRKELYSALSKRMYEIDDELFDLWNSLKDIDMPEVLWDSIVEDVDISRAYIEHLANTLEELSKMY